MATVIRLLSAGAAPAKMSRAWQKAGGTLRCSQTVPQSSTDRALRRLTSEFGRDPVYSARYGRQRRLGVEFLKMIALPITQAKKIAAKQLHRKQFPKGATKKNHTLEKPLITSQAGNQSSHKFYKQGRTNHRNSG